MIYEYSFSGSIVVEADSEDEVFEKADNILGITPWQNDRCRDISIGELHLEDEYEDNN